MCNIAGYVGSKKAVPILIEMLKKQEGFAGGYYTGIATLNDGKIYDAKLIGDTARLLENTQAAKFPGTIGIMHSSSKSGGGDEWAHPFTGVVNGKIECAYIANGSAGCFLPDVPEYSNIARKLDSEGYRLITQVLEKPNSSYPMLTEEESVHMSDVMCQLILRNITNNNAPDEAMANAYFESPGEIVGLLLSLAKPDAITWSRVNMPVFAGVSSHGIYLASTPSAFPDDAGEPQLLPACSYGYVYSDGFTVKTYKEKFVKVAGIYAQTLNKAYEKICEILKSRSCDTRELCKAVLPLFEESDCVPYYAVVYQTLYSLERAGVLKIDVKYVPGVKEGIYAPKFYMSM